MTIGSQPARANEDISACDELAKNPDNVFLSILCVFEFLERNFGPPLGAESARAGIATPLAAVQRLTTVDGTVQPGEPREPGMTRTGWVGFKAPVAARIVVHTFGSKAWESGFFDPLLAVYRGTALSNLTRISGNDNAPLPIISNVQSLVQFNTVAGGNYRVQVGSKNQVEGDIYLNVFSFPPTGGLSALLIQYGGAPFNGKDYSCEIYTTTTSIFCNAKFIVHNSTDGPLAVTASTSLGAGVAASPASFVLQKGGLQVVTFAFNAAVFNKAVRTVSGHFIFTGRTGGTVVTEARHRALVIVRPSSPIDDLIVSRTTPSVRTARVNEPVTFISTIVNTGAVNAIGCHFRSKLYSSVKTTFYSINPVNGARLSADNVPLSIAAGQSRTFKVTTASQGARDADFIDPESIADCANNSLRRSGLRGLDISASAVAEPLPSLSVTNAVPANGVLNVPATGFAYYTFRATNTETAAQLNVLPVYVGPYDDPANSRYSVSICRTNVGNGTCIGGYAGSLSYNAVKGTVAGFSVRVKAPLAAKPFDPDNRRVIVNFKLADAPYYHIAAPSIAVRKQ